MTAKKKLMEYIVLVTAGSWLVCLHYKLQCCTRIGRSFGSWLWCQT